MAISNIVAAFSRCLVLATFASLPATSFGGPITFIGDPEFISGPVAFRAASYVNNLKIQQVPHGFSVSGELDFTAGAAPTVLVMWTAGQYFTVGNPETDTVAISYDASYASLDPTSTAQIVGYVARTAAIQTNIATATVHHLLREPLPVSGGDFNQKMGHASAGQHLLRQDVVIRFSNLTPGEVIQLKFPVTSTIVPEPSSIVMAASGLAVVLGWARVRRRVRGQGAPSLPTSLGRRNPFG